MSATTTTTSTVETKQSSKIDAYGKVKVFTDSYLEQLMHIDEVIAAIKLVLFHRPPPLKSSRYVREHFDLELVSFIDKMVVANDCVHVSSLLLRMLPGPVLVDAQVMSQTLRALDCIEDEPTFYGDDVEKKIEAMLAFRESALGNPNWTLEGVGESPPERRLMQEFPKIHRLYKSLRPQSQAAVRDVTDIMAKGMADFLRKDLSQGTADVAEYNRYCYAISGSVGEGLSRIWSASGLEDESLAKELYLSQQMGNFAIKTAMIFTFIEDFVDKRVKWPKTIWKQYSKTGDIKYFFDQEDPEVQVKSLQCLNAMVTDALEMIPDALKYLSKIKCYENFSWVAIIIVATAAQLDMCYANPKIFKGNVFIRPGLVCKLVLRTNNMEEVHETLHTLTESILRKAAVMVAKNPEAHKADPGYAKTMKACEEIFKITANGAATERRNRLIRTIFTSSLIALGGAIMYLGGPAETLLLMGHSSSDVDLTNKVATTTLVAFASIAYFFGQWVTTPYSPLKKCGRST